MPHTNNHKNGRKRFVLSVDGGGVRGAIAARFLHRLEQALVERGVSSLRQTFDMYGGTSTGAFIAMAIAFENMSAKSIEEQLYTPENAAKIMPRSVWDEMVGLAQRSPKYDGKGKRTVIDKYMSEGSFADVPGGDKHVIITGYDMAAMKPRFFKSWEPVSSGISKREVADITSAAPCYFPSVQHGGRDNSRYGIDGGVFANNPTDCVYADALKLYGKDADIRILSVGTGMSSPDEEDVRAARKSTGWGGIQWISSGKLIEVCTDGPQQCAHYKTRQFASALGHRYLRVNSEISGTTMDNVDEENVLRLYDIGDRWFNMFGDLALALIMDD